MSIRGIKDLFELIEKYSTFKVAISIIIIIVVIFALNKIVKAPKVLL